MRADLTEAGASSGLPRKVIGNGWKSFLAKASFSILLFEAVTGLIITFGPFHPFIQYSILIHTTVGAITLLPFAYYCYRHWLEYRRYAISASVLLGYIALFSLLICSLSGLALTYEGLFGLRRSSLWRIIHLVATGTILLGLVPHLVIAFLKVRRGEASVASRTYLWQSAVCTSAALLLTGLGPLLYSGVKYKNQFPSDYSLLYGEKRPFAPSLAKTDTGGAFDSRSLAGSESCGTSGCHEQIVEEWKPSAHRWAAMDTVFQGIQTVMAKQNGPESTRYCGGCHDPISLFSGDKNIFAENLTGLHGYQEGVSCLSCHAIRETDVKGNANYTVTQPREYLWQWQQSGLARVARDFLIRTYPAEHNKLSKRMFKKPEYCAACHKQFIDAEVNRVGWVQLQNQYDNWSASHWNHKVDAKKTVECRECHMPLVASTDPAAGDSLDYNRNPKDGKHRSHRFVASNQLMPIALKEQLPGWKEQVRLTEEWLAGKTEIPEIREKWAEGPIVKVSLVAPESVSAGDLIPLRVVMTSNKVGHDFPTGPLDIIQSWLEVRATDEAGREIYSSGKRDQKNFLEPGTFLFKAEPVDQHGNLIDRHNLWEMVGVRYRRALFPGYSDTVQYSIPCSGALSEEDRKKLKDGAADRKIDVPAPVTPGRVNVTVSLQYRKVDQFLLNFLFGEKTPLSSPVAEIARAETSVTISPKANQAAGGQ